MEFVGALFPLAILVAIAFAISSVISRSRRDRSDSTSPGIGARFVFFYLFSFTALMVGASGASVLLGYIVDSLRSDLIVAPGDSQLALGLALSLVGIPAWLFTWRFILRSTEARPYDTRSTVRGLYIYVIEAVSLGFFAAGVTSLLVVILGGDSLEGTDIAWPVAFGAIWSYHWWVESDLSASDRAATPFRSFYLYIASAAFLIMLLTGLGTVLQRLLDRAYTSLFVDDVLVTSSLWGDPMKTSLAVAAVGGVYWWWHWFRGTRSDTPTALRQVYTYVFGVLFGVVTFVVSISMVIVVVLQWLLSAPSISPAGEHFRVLTGLIPAILAGGALWSYHATVLQRESASAIAPESARRIYNYLLASLSLATLAVGLVFLIALFISVSVREARSYLVDGEGWQGQLSIVLTLLVVGGGIWTYYWYRIQRFTRSAPSELETSSRRIHIYSVFGVSALAALGSLSTALFLFLQAVLESDLSAETLKDAQWAIAVLIATGITSGYFALVIREDRRVLASQQSGEEKPTKKYVTILLPESAIAISDALAKRLGYRIKSWLEPGIADAPQLTDEQLDIAVGAIASAKSENILVVVNESGLDVRPYRT
ncbi:MAG: DUF5671 domain-containing protein [Chloroflexi bacterium]|nr:DUF5671 domain-containing protein [Chloroflexota bacterium]